MDASNCCFNPTSALPASPTFPSVNETNPVIGYDVVLCDYEQDKYYAGRVSIPEHTFYRESARKSGHIDYRYLPVREQDSSAYAEVEFSKLINPFIGLTRVHPDHFRTIFRSQESARAPTSPVCFLSGTYTPPPSSSKVNRELFCCPELDERAHNREYNFFNKRIDSISSRAYKDLKLVEKKFALLRIIGRRESWMEVLHFFRSAILRWRKDYVLPYRPDLFDVVTINSSFKAHLDAAVKLHFPSSVILLWQERFNEAEDPLLSSSLTPSPQLH